MNPLSAPLDKISTLFNKIRTHTFPSPYQKDQKIVENYTGAKLTEEQFNSYGKFTTLHGRLTDHLDEYSHRSDPDIFIAADILTVLEGLDVTFSLEDDKSPFFTLLHQNMSYCLSNNEYHNLPDCYAHSEQLKHLTIAPLQNKKEAPAYQDHDGLS